VEAGTVVIGGLFRGEILAYEKVVLLSSCVVLGTVTAPRLIVEEGVLFSGRCRITGGAEDLVPASDAAARRKELLLESVEKREQSGAAGRGDVRPRDKAKTQPVDAIGVAGREPTSWNG
jgi:cytoskeletal protein CcmA (bactofilin family)